MNLKSFLRAFGVTAVILSLFPFVAADYWWIRMFDFPHVQLTVLTLLALLVYFLRFDLRDWRDYSFITVLTACFLLQLVKIYPYTPFAEMQVKENEVLLPQKSFSIMASNVLQKNREYDKVIDEVLRKDPDLLVFTETDQIWRNELQKRLIDFNYPFQLEMPLSNTYGMLFYSKLQLVEPEIRFLLKDSIPSMHSKVILPGGEIIEVHIIHPTPPLPPHDATSTDRDAQMMMVAKAAKNAKYPVIVTGDFNDVAWSETTSLFQDVSQLLDPRIGRGFYNTFNVNSWLMRWPLDHIFVSKDFRLVDMELGRNVDSDHFPLHIKLSLEPQNSEEQEMPEPSGKELKKAQKQIENQAEKEQKERKEKS